MALKMEPTMQFSCSCDILSYTDNSGTVFILYRTKVNSIKKLGIILEGTQPFVFQDYTLCQCFANRLYAGLRKLQTGVRGRGCILVPIPCLTLPRGLSW